jgi:hypothetical protein
MAIIIICEIGLSLYADMTDSRSGVASAFLFHHPLPIFSTCPRFLFTPISGYQTLADFPSKVLPSCTLCNFTVRNFRPDSSPRDVIVTSMFDQVVNVVPFIRSLRTTGSRATVILFYDASAKRKIDSNLSSFFNSCAITLLEIDLTHRSPRHSFILRHLLFAEFFRTRYHLFDRILSVDLFDTVFQGDPFFEGFDRDSISLNSHFEPATGTHLYGILGLIGSSDENVAYYVAHTPNMNAGLSTGGIELHLRFWECFRQMLMSGNDTVLESLVYADQDIINSIVNSNLTRRAGVPIRLYGSEDYFHLAVKLWAREGVINELGEYKMPGVELYPLVIHQADRSAPLTSSILRACPQEFPMAEKYLRC